MTSEIARLIVERDIAYNIWDKNKTEDNRSLFLLLSKKTTKAFRSAKRRLHSHNLDPNQPSKALWRNLKKMVIKDDPENECIFTANELNAHYSSTASQSHQPQNSFPAYDSNPTTGLFSFRNVDDLEVLNAISRVKAMDTDLDGIPLKFIKLILPLILPCITHIYNTILTTSMFPKSWKISKVIPIAKLKNPSSPGDYRPISILPSLSKALEILMKDQILSFVIRFGLLNRLQSGFHSAHSTTTALLNDFHKGCERRMVTVLLLLDFSKAFDSVIQDLLCKKLSTIFKFDSTATSFIKSYLSGRFQCVSIRNEISSLAPILKEVV
jgi:Reverse transcriptase (RNA-dependent DNA polymerase)